MQHSEISDVVCRRTGFCVQMGYHLAQIVGFRGGRKKLGQEYNAYSELEGCVGVGHIQTLQTQKLGFVESQRHEPQRQAEVTWSHSKVKVTMGKPGEVF